MCEDQPHLHPEELERTYHILVGMACRKRFLNEQDREDFVQNVMLSAFRSYDAGRRNALSFKNLACGPAFHRTYQSYWRDYYRSPRLQPLGAGDDPATEDGLSHHVSGESGDLLLVQVFLEEIDNLEPPLDALMRLLLQGSTRSEAASEMGKSVSWAKKYTLKARSLLMKRLKARGITADPAGWDRLFK